MADAGRSDRGHHGGAGAAPPALDAVDLDLLAALAADAGSTIKAVARRLGLAESTCAYRLRALRAAGVILGTRLEVDLKRLGYPLHAVVKVRLGNHSQADVDQLYASMASAPGVTQVLHLAGADDFHVQVVMRDSEALRDFVVQRISSHRIVRQTETLLVFSVRQGPGVLGGGPALTRNGGRPS